MPNVTCPSCGEKGKIPPQFIGTRIKCKKCGNAFLVSPPAAKPEAAGAPPAPDPAAAGAPAPAAAAAAAPAAADKHGMSDEIAVDGLDASAWEATSVAAAEHHDELLDEVHDPAASAFTTPHDPGAIKQYKFLWSKDKFFEATRYDLDTIEQALNLYARQGWVAKGMTNTHVIIRGVDKEQLVILLER